MDDGRIVHAWPASSTASWTPDCATRAPAPLGPLTGRRGGTQPGRHLSGARLTSSLVGPTVEGVPLDYRGCNLRAECRASERPVNVGNPGGCSSARLPRGPSRAIHPRVVVAVAGGMAARLVSGLMRWRRSRRVAPGRTARAAFSMLPPDVQAAVTAALREEEDSIQALHAKQADRPDRARATPAAVPPYLFVVRSDKPGTFSSLRKLAWTRPDLLGVVFDRRWMGERRSQGQPERTGRRCAERRRPEPERSWTRRGFVLVAPAAPSRPLQAPSVSLPSRRTVLAKRAKSAGARRGTRSRRRAVALGLGTLSLFAAAVRRRPLPPAHRSLSRGDPIPPVRRGNHRAPTCAHGCLQSRATPPCPDGAGAWVRSARAR